MKKLSFLLLAMAIALALLCVKEPVVPVFGGLTQTSSASDTNTLAEQHFGKAIALLKQMSYQEAIAEYEKVIKLLPKSEIALDAQYWIGQSYFRMGRHDEALSIFQKLITDYPGSAIIPVTKLMIARVEKDKKDKKTQTRRILAMDKDIITDPKTGTKFNKVKVITGRKDVIGWARGHLILSPNSKFLLYDTLVIPLNGDAPFELVDIPAGYPAWSPDGKKIALTSKDAIWMVLVTPETGSPTGAPKKLIDYHASVSWSPDSKKVGFVRRDTGQDGGVWTLNIENGKLTQITDDPVWGGSPQWSPDGRTIVYTRKDRSLCIVLAEGGKPKKIVDFGHPHSFSPDGKWFFFRKGIRPYLFRLADERVFDINLPYEIGEFLAWSNDGKKMLFYRSSYEFNSNLKVVSTSSGPSFQLGRELQLWPYGQYWTPDSEMIITPGGEVGKTTGQPTNAPPRLWMIPLAGGEANPFDLDLSVEGNVEGLSLSPDCRKLLCIIQHNLNKEDLYVVPVSLKEARTIGPPIAVFKGRDKKPFYFGGNTNAWSPDGKKLAVVHEGNIWITSSDKGEPVQITKAPQLETSPLWSPNGKKIAYILRDIDETVESEQSLTVIAATGGKVKKISNTSGTNMHAWSPDGKELAVISKGKISVILIDGGKARQILDLKSEGLPEKARELCWFADGKHFAFIGENNGARIYLVSVKDAKVIELASDDDGWKYGINPSPDGKWISYVTDDFFKIRSEASIWEVNVEELIREEKK